VGCKLLYPDGTIQHAGGFLHGPRGESGHIGRHALDDGRFDRVTDVEFVTAAALAISRIALEQIGLLDEAFKPAYYEDVDWCYRARAAGYRVICQPRAVVAHYESTTADQMSHEHKFALHRGRLRFLLKHCSVETLIGEFGPAELAWLAQMDRSEELMAARRAYLESFLALSGILGFRRSPPEEADALIGLLADLRSAAIAGLACPPLDGDRDRRAVDGRMTQSNHERSSLLADLEDHQALAEHTFTSDVPLIGRLIVAVRNIWANVAARWVVAPLLQQQTLFNTQSVRYLYGLERKVQEQSRDIAENIRELTALTRYLVTLQGESIDRRQREDSED
jgi:hypothetical protein